MSAPRRQHISRQLVRTPGVWALSSREWCVRDLITSSDWIIGSRRATWEIITPLLLNILKFVTSCVHTPWSLFSTCNMRFTPCLILPPPILPASSISSSAWTAFLFEPHSLLSFCFVNTTSLYSEFWGVGGQRGDRGPGREGEGWMSVELVGWSGAAPPVIIRVTAARARLCAACTRRDVLPREKREHLSVPPRRQQPPTSLSNSTQLVTRSPNSYFLSLAHAQPLWATLYFISCFTHSLLYRQLLSLSLVRTGCESSRPLVQCRLQKLVHVIFGLKWILCEHIANTHSATEQLFLFKL